MRSLRRNSRGVQVGDDDELQEVLAASSQARTLANLSERPCLPETWKQTDASIIIAK